MTRIVKILNADTQARNWLGQTVDPGTYYTISGQELNNWANNSQLLVDIVDGYAVVNDGSDDIIDINDEINWLKGITAEKRTSTGTLIAAITKPDYGDVKIFSHNFADATTWYTESIRTTELLHRRDADGSIWYGSHRNWIDLIHGKITGEDQISSAYIPVVHVYDSYGVMCGLFKEKDPHSGEGNYEIFYDSGEVRFDEGILDNYADGYVKATYSYATTSFMYIRPTPGKLLSVERSEVQFTTDIIMKDTVCFQLWVYAYIIETSLGLPIGTLAPYGEKYPYSAVTKYKSTADFVAEANGNYPVCPAFGGPSWRGMMNDIITLPFEYTSIKPLRYSYGAEIRVWLEHHSAMDGSYGTVTFYCHSEDED